MDDLAAWLTAQLDEDERIARAACKYASPEWHLDEEFGETVLWWAPEFHTRYEEDKRWRGEALDQHLAPHIAEHDPARVLREVAAKRKQIARIVNHAALMGWDEIHGDLLRTMAAVYDARPGYQESWRP